MIKFYFVRPFTVSNILLGFVFFFSFNSSAQTFTDSNLPIVSITTDNNPNTNLPLDILDDPKILATMKIIKRPDGTRNYLTDINTPTFLNYNGRIGIEIRGSSSQTLPKKGYGLTTLKADNTSNNNVELLGMPSENDWILNGIAFDPSLVRDYLSYNLSRQIGNYATRTAYCEVVINGEYKGLYILQEKIKAGSDRVNVLKIGTSDITSPNVTGGFITKADKTTGGDPIAWSMPSYTTTVDFIHELPKPAAVQPAQTAYIYDQFLQLASTSNANATSVINGYPSVIDVPSFVDFMLINELASNADAYQFSTYFHKDRNGKLRAGPIWDFNLTYGNDLFLWGFDRSKTDIWQFSNGDNEGAKFWTDLFNNPLYKCYFAKRWNQLTQTGQPLNYSSLVQFVDATLNYISEAKVREHQKWGTVTNQDTEITNLKAFLSNRISWITTNLGSYSDCNSVVIPALVINKINYNPVISDGFPANDLEFIEIKNTGATTVNLTGFYLRELGVSYQFPANSSVLANESIFLASNPTTFKAKYGITAFGQFTRNLSNSSQKLVLADGYGNTIDSVEYFDVAPWPADADGQGSYLQLIDTTLDNGLASSWISSSSVTLATPSYVETSTISVYPNPVADILNIRVQKTIKGVKIFDVSGHLITEIKPKTDMISVDFSSYSKGLYFITIYDENTFTTTKVIKQ
ncbi:CotH kinase family protein [Flavobacterium lacustre]|uniref:CotH kinase family protein n=1 Tax=Flavobacterium lacustre TaxID=3016339 RepID=UPI0022B657AD|nr:CotH kinase family protein [Flavobacterium lacustre]